MKMETTTLAIVKMVKNLDKVYTSCTMVMLSKVNGPMTALMARVQKDKLTAIYTKACLRMDKNTDMEPIIG